MKLSNLKKICLISAFCAWLINPYAAIASDDPGAEIIFDEMPAPVIEKPAYIVTKTSTHKITAYTSEAAQTDSTPCITANGFNLCKHGIEDSIAANFLDFGTKIRIPELFGDRVFVVRDRMNRRYKNRIDVWMKDRKEAINFGIQTVTIEILADNN